jgi:uncharacterized protein (TIGR00297 family)
VTTELVFALTSLVAAGTVASVAWRAHALNRNGALAATAVGAPVLAFGGLTWAIALVAFFVVASMLSAFRGDVKAARMGARGDPLGGRRARQVLANGIWAALAAVGHGAWPGALWSPIFFGSLAAASADTWATEIGVLARQAPRSIRTGRPVPTGTSGGVTWLGSAAALAGAAFLGAIGLALGELDAAGAQAVWIGGSAGAFVDSWLGATVQARYRCAACGDPLESRRHPDCAGSGVRVGGLSFVDNDLVNLLGSGVGAALALAFWSTFSISG